MPAQFKNGFGAILILVVLLAVGVAAAAGLYFVNKNSSSTPNLNATNSPEMKNDDTNSEQYTSVGFKEFLKQGKIDASNWKTCENENYSFKYPSDWNVDGENCSEVGFDGRYKTSDGELDTIRHNIEISLITDTKGMDYNHVLANILKEESVIPIRDEEITEEAIRSLENKYEVMNVNGNKFYERESMGWPSTVYEITKDGLFYVQVIVNSHGCCGEALDQEKYNREYLGILTTFELKNKSN